MVILRSMPAQLRPARSCAIPHAPRSVHSSRNSAEEQHQSATRQPRSSHTTGIFCLHSGVTHQIHSCLVFAELGSERELKLSNLI